MPHLLNSEKRACSAFTLLEIIVVLAILVIVISLSVPYLGSILEENRFFGVTNHLEIFATTARSSALQENQPWQVIFYPDHFEVGRAALGSNAFVASSSYSLPDNFGYQIQPWPQTIWHSPTNDTWSFYASGFNLPLSLRLTNSSNTNWLEVTFHPLTGQIYTNSYSIQ